MDTDRKLSIRIAGNTQNPVLQTLLDKGYRIWFEPDENEDCEFLDWNAEKEGRYFSATDPAELLGLVAMQEHRGDDWQCELEDQDIVRDLIGTAYPDDDHLSKFVKMPFGIYDFYDEVFLRPELFIGKKSISLMVPFLSGVKSVSERMRQSAVGAFEPRRYGDYIGCEFDRWLSKRLNSQDFQASCDLIIQQYEGEEKALDRLGALYREFRGHHFGAYAKFVSGNEVKL